MIKIDFYKNGFTCQGHANSDKYNKDIVCAGVSAIVLGALNWFDDKRTVIKIGENIVKVICLDEIDYNLLNLLKIQLKALLHGEYLKYISIIEYNSLLN